MCVVCLATVQASMELKSLYSLAGKGVEDKAASVKGKIKKMMEGNLSLEAVIKEAVDLENIPLEEVFDHLKCIREGLSSEQVQQRLDLFGYNKLEEKRESKILKFLGFMWNPLSWVMEAAAIMDITMTHTKGEQADYQDFASILLLINVTTSFIEENNASNAAAALMARLAPKAKVLRDGKWSEEDASVLVPGDIVSIKLGDIILADARLLEGDPLKIQFNLQERRN